MYTRRTPGHRVLQYADLVIVLSIYTRCGRGKLTPHLSVLTVAVVSVLTVLLFFCSDLTVVTVVVLTTCPQCPPAARIQTWPPPASSARPETLNCAAFATLSPTVTSTAAYT